jgi:hypothetical protein
MFNDKLWSQLRRPRFAPTSYGIPVTLSSVGRLAGVHPTHTPALVG